jgi:hypothetical protein
VSAGFSDSGAGTILCCCEYDKELPGFIYTYGIFDEIRDCHFPKMDSVAWCKLIFLIIHITSTLSNCVGMVLLIFTSRRLAQR